MASMPANMSSARKQVAVPFVGKDVPSQAAEFAHPEVLIGPAILASTRVYVHLSIREIVSMLKQAVREVGSYEHQVEQTVHSVGRPAKCLVQSDIS